jgi:hypothetical protein
MNMQTLITKSLDGLTMNLSISSRAADYKDKSQEYKALVEARQEAKEEVRKAIP